MTSPIPVAEQSDISVDGPYPPSAAPDVLLNARLARIERALAFCVRELRQQREARNEYDRGYHNGYSARVAKEKKDHVQRARLHVGPVKGRSM